MTIFDRARRVARPVSAVVLGLGLALSAAACSGETDTGVTASVHPAPTEQADRVQLTEGVPLKVRTESGEATSVQIIGYEDGDNPAVVISVGKSENATEEHTLRLGENVDIAGDPWRVSEIGVSDVESQPGSATLIRSEN